MKTYISLFVSLLTFCALVLPAQAESDTWEKYPRLEASLEYGFLGVMSHTIQFSQNNTNFDYVKEGGQDTLFPLPRMSLDLQLDPHQTLVFMYQPLTLSSQAVLSRDIRQDNQTFLRGTPMRFLYDFPFFRGSYLYDFNTDVFEELAVGVSLQLRDAVIEFESLDGKQLVSKTNIGPVPILKFRSRHRINEIWWWGSEIDGFYAPVSYLNGSTNEVIGAILDANLRVGANLSDTYYPYLNLRYLGGGSVGTSEEKGFSGDGYSNNWLHFLIVSVGITAHLF
ncbi:hypothetical protein COW36_15225 [bacterium (Candidatus Blackallbacteria) CG17_big_fil_post_rev_8_21_14_2_50_48_46]|uniref:Uncharacterized protein n=1 Tax=bacterium (Candidatus Blackallbacteria) CG17_big_fil_post_rev_8_21_14_2_50_48_46 TaxID=2014261 RepID=A0A2M7G3M5_9BACT|nr:MAG: hypothetical protein COW64_11325 [bacterium (Candidatus Blackallbacteria) CG18_big_fil_WC_8_21_14_2_50_49_26]PIW16062.1 MAG: hypothetical protein COW36_15225 [bacterium (Candidatus Blackallbacteria) CG17_big_fil_post_rev_8_21_14_2_50_48_46]PIW50474.1 MAG: hypothetical protein COW20_02940 [bacterium (Candidatus Blackallbacteria) CG13_big_fil_rev_8_21_14_2_50_49_14]